MIFIFHVIRIFRRRDGPTLAGHWLARNYSKGISGVEEVQADLLKGYLGEGKYEHAIDEHLARAQLFYVLILTKIVVRRVPIYKKERAAMTELMIHRAAQVLHKTVQA